MQIERYRPGRSVSQKPSRFSCLVLIIVIITVGVFLVLVLIPRLPGVALQVAGFQPVGEVDTVFESAPTAIPTQSLENIAAPNQITVDAGSLGTQQLDGNSTAYTIEIGAIADSGAAEVMRVTLDEAGLLQLCNQYGDVCGTTHSLIRNARFDLRTGGAVINAELFTQQIGWQAVGIVVQLNTTNQIEIAGMDIDGTLYALPEGQIGDTAVEIEQVANRALREATVQAQGSIFRLSEIIVDDSTVTLILQ